jgi:hypothetical protein
MHIREGDLRAYLDGQLPESRLASLASHLANCQTCQNRLSVLQQRASLASGILGEGPRVSNKLSSGPARARLEALIKQKEKNYMNSRFKAFGIRFAAGAVVLAVLVGLLAVPQVRAIANNFLGLFRVEQVVVVPFNPSGMDTTIRSAGPQLEQMIASDVKVTELGPDYQASSAAEAAALVDFPVRLPAGDAEPGQISVKGGKETEYTVDLPRLQAILRELGHDTSILPDSLDQAVITARIPNSVAASYGDCDKRNYAPDRPHFSSVANCKLLVQLPSPTVSAPAGLDVDALALLFLQAAGMNEQEAVSFRERIDWATTLVIPVPPDASSKDVTVDGVQGVLVESRNSAYLIIWVKDGILYALSGSGDSSSAFNMANSLKVR